MQTEGEALQQIAKKPNVWFTILESPYNFVSPFDGQEYVLLIINCDSQLSNEQENRLADQFVTTGCRNAFCAGYGCSRFHDAIDWAYMYTDPTGNFDPPDDTHIMTSWYEDTAVEEVIETMFLIADFDDLHFENFVVVMVGNQPSTNHQVLKALQHQVSEEKVEISELLHSVINQVKREAKESSPTLFRSWRPWRLGS